MIRPTHRRLPWIDPGDAFARLAGRNPVVFFDSNHPHHARSRHSMLCLDPVHVLRAEAGRTTLDGHAVAAAPLESLRGLLRERRAVAAPMPFTGGAAGFIGYDLGAAWDRAPRAPGNFAGVPDLWFGIFETVLAFDHAARAMWLFAPSAAVADDICAQLAAAPAIGPARPEMAWRALVSRESHMQRVVQTLRHIAAGDLYQANIAAGFAAPRPDTLCPAALYLALRAKSPAPNACFIDMGDGTAILSVSPEQFVSVSADGVAQTRPIKGTRPRGDDDATDAAQAASLLASEKDRAENLMIVDLLRNDFARVADRVTVPSLFALESFAHVHHLVSTVRGHLRAGCDAIDLLRAAFPGGSITGAPKLAAMRIIAEQEQTARGPYCGAAAWIGFDGAMDSNILIRTLTVAHDCIVAQAGGGIVADSDPAAEWDEVLVKIMPLLRATGTL